MIKPDAYYAAHKAASTPDELGRLGFALVGRDGELNPPLSGSERLLVATICKCNEWHTEAAEATKARWRDNQRRHRSSKQPCHQCHDDNDDNDDNGMSPTSSMSPLPSVRPSVRPSVLPKEGINRSVTVRAREAKTERNGNGTVDIEVKMPGGLVEAKRLAQAFADDARKDPAAFFAPEHDAVSICAAITGDFRSLKRWRKLVTDKGEVAIRQEAFAFWREVSSGEDVDNRGAALNARLGRLSDINEERE